MIGSRVLVTGASGFLGRHLVRYLESQGYEVRAVGRTQLPWCLKADLCDLDQMIELATGFGNIFHMAGTSDVTASLADPVLDARANYLTTVAVMELAKRLQANVLLASSAAVYGRGHLGPIAENARCRPISPYGVNKLAAETYALHFGRAEGIVVRIARMFSVYGHGMPRLAPVEFAERLIADPSELAVRGSGTQCRHYIHVRDAVRALVHLMDNCAPYETVNVAQGQSLTIMELAHAIAKAVGAYRCRIVRDGIVEDGKPDCLTADLSKLTAIGFRAEFDYQAGFEQIFSNWSPAKRVA